MLAWVKFGKPALAIAVLWQDFGSIRDCSNSGFSCSIVGLLYGRKYLLFVSSSSLPRLSSISTEVIMSCDRIMDYNTCGFFSILLNLDVASVFSSPHSPSSFVVWCGFFQLVKAAEFSFS